MLTHVLVDCALALYRHLVRYLPWESMCYSRSGAGTVSGVMCGYTTSSIRCELLDKIFRAQHPVGAPRGEGTGPWILLRVSRSNSRIRPRVPRSRSLDLTPYMGLRINILSEGSRRRRVKLFLLQDIQDATTGGQRCKFYTKMGACKNFDKPSGPTPSPPA